MKFIFLSLILLIILTISTVARCENDHADAVVQASQKQPTTIKPHAKKDWRKRLQKGGKKENKPPQKKNPHKKSTTTSPVHQ
uniref:Uncharacterized protein n=1 Tax=Rhabditophanes sp. KR3021 TaxID=114890 RepID=A0AC35UH22_9BILA